MRSPADFSSCVDWILRSPDGHEHALTLDEGADGVSIGRDLTCDITLADASISRHHATLTLVDEHLWIEDLHSQNGTFVNSERVGRCRLRQGDRVTLGHVHLTVVQLDASDELDELPEVSPEEVAAVPAARPRSSVPKTPGIPASRRLDRDPVSELANRLESTRRPARSLGLDEGQIGRLLGLVEGQIGRLRRRLVDEDRLDPASHDDLVELSLATRAVTLLLGGDAWSRRPIDLARSVRHVAESSPLISEPEFVDTNHTAQVDAPLEPLQLIIELLLSSARRFHDGIELRITEDEETSSARLSLESVIATNADDLIDWSDQDLALVLARGLVEVMADADSRVSLRVQPERGCLELELPLVRSLGRSSDQDAAVSEIR